VLCPHDALAQTCTVGLTNGPDQICTAGSDQPPARPTAGSDQPPAWPTAGLIIW